MATVAASDVLRRLSDVLDMLFSFGRSHFFTSTFTETAPLYLITNRQFPQIRQFSFSIRLVEPHFLHGKP